MFDLDGISKEIDRPVDDKARRAIIVGLVTQILLLGPGGTKRLSVVLREIVPAIAAGQIKLYFDRYGIFVGYIVWATLAEDIEQRMLKERNFELGPEDRVSGSSLWVTDLVVTQGHLPYVLSDMRDTLFAALDEITYFRVKPRKRIAKRVSRNGKYAFFRRGAMACARI